MHAHVYTIAVMSNAIIDALKYMIEHPMHVFMWFLIIVLGIPVGIYIVGMTIYLLWDTWLDTWWNTQITEHKYRTGNTIILTVGGAAAFIWFKWGDALKTRGNDTQARVEDTQAKVDVAVDKAAPVADALNPVLSAPSGEQWTAIITFPIVLIMIAFGVTLFIGKLRDDREKERQAEQRYRERKERERQREEQKQHVKAVIREKLQDGRDAVDGITERHKLVNEALQEVLKEGDYAPRR